MSKIPEYRQLSPEEIEALQAVHDMGAEVSALMQKLQQIQSVDKRWLNIAKTDLQKGFMSAVRSISKPDTF